MDSRVHRWGIHTRRGRGVETTYGRGAPRAQLGASPFAALVRIFKDTERSLIAKVSHAPNSVPFDFAPSGPCPRLPLLSFQSDSLMIQGSRSKL